MSACAHALYTSARQVPVRARCARVRADHARSLSRTRTAHTPSCSGFCFSFKARAQTRTQSTIHMASRRRPPSSCISTSRRSIRRRLLNLVESRNLARIALCRRITVSNLIREGPSAACLWSDDDNWNVAAMSPKVGEVGPPSRSASVISIGLRPVEYRSIGNLYHQVPKSIMTRTHKGNLCQSPAIHFPRLHALIGLSDSHLPGASRHWSEAHLLLHSAMDGGVRGARE